MRIRRFTARLLLGCAIVALSVTSCAKDYVTGRRTFSLVSESQEMQMGKEADPQIVAEYGLYDDPDLATFVNGIGQRIAAVSHRPQLTYTVRVVDSPIVNAFAIPGGYVYITRGILAHFNSEDELAGVMGHEIGHVVARHSAEQMSRQQLGAIGLGVASALSETFAQFADFAGAGLGLLFLSYGRDQESESDLLGVEYSTKLGYDAHRMAAFFKTLKRMSDQSGQSLPGFLSTHPDPGDREVRVNQLADEWQGKVAYTPLNTNPDDYLRRIDGIVYGPDPRQGFRENDRFYHPGMAFQFPVPSGWQLVNSPSTVVMVAPNKEAIVQLSLGKAQAADTEASEFVTKNQAIVSRRESIVVHGFPAVVVESAVPTSDGQLDVLSYFIEKGASVLVFHGFTTPAKYGGYVDVFTRVMGGFEAVTDPKILNRQPKRIRIESSPVSASMETVLERMGMGQDVIEELALLNGRTRKEPVQKGELIKVVR